MRTNELEVSMRIEELCHHCCSDLTEEAELGDLKEDSKLGNQWDC